MRLLSGVLAGAGVFAVLSGDDSLRRRPMARVVEPLRRTGARIDGRDGGRLPPLRAVARFAPARRRASTDSRQRAGQVGAAAGRAVRGWADDRRRAGADARSHRAHAARDGRATLQHVGLDDRPDAGTKLRAVDVEVPGDFSSAAFWLVLGCLHPIGRSARRERRPERRRAPGLLTILERMGAPNSKSRTEER